MDNEMMPEENAAPVEPTVGESGYKICLVPLPNDQFHVYKMSASGGEDAQEMEAPRDTIDGIENALKEVIALYRANPTGGDEESGMKAGYTETSRRMGR